MDKRYLKYKNTYFREDWKAFSLFFEHFYEPKIHYFNGWLWFRRFYYNGQRLFLPLVFFLRLHRLVCREVFLGEDFIIKKESYGGRFGSDAILTEDQNKEGSFLLKKIFYSADAYRAYKDYYLKYYQNSTKICLPRNIFDDSCLSPTIEFIRSKSLTRLIAEGKIGVKAVWAHVAEICRQINQLETAKSEDPCLVHGDLSVANIFIQDERYYLIDYADSFVYKKKYDEYFLIKSILKYAGIKISERDLFDQYLSLSQAELEEYEKVYQARRQEKKKELFD